MRWLIMYLFCILLMLWLNLLYSYATEKRRSGLNDNAESDSDSWVEREASRTHSVKFTDDMPEGKEVRQSQRTKILLSVAANRCINSYRSVCEYCRQRHYELLQNRINQNYVEYYRCSQYLEDCRAQCGQCFKSLFCLQYLNGCHNRSSQCFKSLLCRTSGSEADSAYRYKCSDVSYHLGRIKNFFDCLYQNTLKKCFQKCNSEDAYVTLSKILDTFD